jgi:hypothetical protein
MFSLHERTQRRVCRTAFVAFCALPTIVVFGWVAYFHRPWSERDWQRSIEHTLHVGAQVEELSAPRPLMRKISKLSLTDLETKLPLLEVDELLVHSADEVEVQHVTIHTPQFGDIAKALQIWLAGNDFATINWQAEHVTLVGPAQQRFELEDVVIKSQSTTAGTRQIVLRCASGPQLVIERGASGMTHFSLESNQTNLPAWLLANTMPGAGRWSSANFNGNLQLQKSRGSVAGSFKGEINGIDCHEWIGSDSLQAKASLQIEVFTWQSDRVELLQGILQTSPGHISSSLLKPLSEKLFCRLAHESMLTSPNPIAFDKLATTFSLSSVGLTCFDPYTDFVTKGPGPLITVGSQTLVMQPGLKEIPLTHLVQLFFAVERDVLPGNREATEMGDKLPLPEAPKRK